jgi:hypothetical protein
MALQQAPLGRRAVYQQQIVGVDIITSGSGTWTVPGGVDCLDIVAIGKGGATPSGVPSGMTYAASGGVCERIAKRVSPGQGIGYAIGSDATVDGMTAGGAPSAPASGGWVGTTPGSAAGGDKNLIGSKPGGAGGTTPSLTTDGGLTTSSSSVPPVTPDYPGTSNAAFGGGGYSGSSGAPGGAAGIVIVMYKLVS